MLANIRLGRKGLTVANITAHNGSVTVVKSFIILAPRAAWVQGMFQASMQSKLTELATAHQPLRPEKNKHRFGIVKMFVYV